MTPMMLLALAAFCIFLALFVCTLVLDIHGSTGLSIASGLLCALSFVAVLFITIQESQQREEENYVDVTNCEVIGSALDKGRSRVFYHKIYECPDGSLHIR